jgi:hypothetical protein
MRGEKKKSIDSNISHKSKKNKKNRNKNKSKNNKNNKNKNNKTDLPKELDDIRVLELAHKLGLLQQ